MIVFFHKPNFSADFQILRKAPKLKTDLNRFRVSKLKTKYIFILTWISMAIFVPKKQEKNFF